MTGSIWKTRKSEVASPIAVVSNLITQKSKVISGTFVVAGVMRCQSRVAPPRARR